MNNVTKGQCHKSVQSVRVTLRGSEELDREFERGRKRQREAERGKERRREGEKGRERWKELERFKEL